MKKIIIILLTVIVCGLSLTACENPSDRYHDFTVAVSGDVFRLAIVNAKSLDSFLFTDGKERYYGFRLGEFLSKVQLRGDDGTILIFGQEKAIEIPLSFLPHCYLASSMDGYFNLYNTQKSSLTEGITGVSEIMFLSESHSGGILLNDTDCITYRKIFDCLYERTGTAHAADGEFVYYSLSRAPYAKKLLNEDFTVYLDNGERVFISSAHNTTFHWEDGRLFIAKEESPVRYVMSD